MIQSEQQKEKQILKNEHSLRNSGTTSSIPMLALHEPQKQKRERKGHTIHLMKLWLKNYLNLKKETDIQRASRITESLKQDEPKEMECLYI